MQPATRRDRIYVLTLILTLVAIGAFGVFVVRDYQDERWQRVEIARVGGAPSITGAAALPAWGDAGPAGSGAIAAGGAPANAPSKAAPGVPGTAAAVRGSSIPKGSGSAGRTGGGRPASLPGGDSPACVDGHIRIGQILAVTRPITMQTAANATAAYFKKVNAEGGINGCQVDFTYLDDGGLDQQKVAADARELVQADNVFAIVGGYQPVTATTTEPLTRASLLAALNGLRDYHTGFTPDLTMTPDHGPNKQVLWIRWDGSQFSQAQPFSPW